MSTGGSILAVSIDGREFSVASDSDSQRSLGGFTNEFEANGNGTGRTIKSRMPFKVSGIGLSIDDDIDDQEYLQEKIDNNNLFTFAVTYVNGSTYQGRATITGDLEVGSQKTTASVAFSGPAKLVKQ